MTFKKHQKIKLEIKKEGKIKGMVLVFHSV